MCALFAATYPAERTAGAGDDRQLRAAAARRRLPVGARRCSAARTASASEILQHLGRAGRHRRTRAEPSPTTRRSATGGRRTCATGRVPNAAVALTRMNAEIDVRSVLPTIHGADAGRAPHAAIAACRSNEGPFPRAAAFPVRQLVELPGDDHLPFVGDQHAIVTAIEQFLAKAKAPAAPNRQLATIVRAKGRDAAGADLAGWRHAVVQGPAMAQSRSLAVADDELLAVFDGPARAIRAAREVAAVAARFHASMAIVVHTGECKRSVHGVAGAVVDESEAPARARGDRRDRGQRNGTRSRRRRGLPVRGARARGARRRVTRAVDRRLIVTRAATRRRPRPPSRFAARGRRGRMARTPRPRRSRPRPR